MLARDLKGRAVLTLSDATKVGTIDDVLYDAEFRQVLGFRIKKSTFSGAEALLRENVASVGRDAVTIATPEVINTENRFPSLANAATEGQGRGTKVVTEGGEFLGTVEDLEIDDQAQTVIGYLLTTSLIDRLRHRQPEIQAQQVVRLGAGGIMIVPDSVAEAVHSQQNG